MTSTSRAIDKKLTSCVERAYTNGYYEGASYALYKLAEKLSIGSKDIRLSQDEIAAKAEQLAMRIIEAFGTQMAVGVDFGQTTQEDSHE